ncbi:MAG TPA: carbamoyltransferase C-terminal domain-containing protein [Candidatus Sulfotelmatobacter sp.]|nr:carbamoyltransferase C-terminal domain-containing protein [Candidatus Sulfotelmatobacter sp.]
MAHLGISTSHNATVAVVRDGTVVFCQSEERIARLKNVAGFPAETLEFLFANVIDRSAVRSCTFAMRSPNAYRYLAERGFRPHRYEARLNLAQVERWKTHPSSADIEEWGVAPGEPDRTPDADALRAVSRAIGLDVGRLKPMDHHAAHMYSVLPFLPADPVERWLFLTLDGLGDGLCATVSGYADGRFERLAITDDLASLGMIYWLVTGMLGFTMNEHEYKIMGLAPYSRREHHERLVGWFRELLWVDENGAWQRSYQTIPELRYRLREIVFVQRFDAVAGALQDYTEEMVVRWASHWMHRTGIGSVACAGGVFMNVKVNQRLEALPDIERLVVVPSAGDESTAIGAAVHGSLTSEPNRAIARAPHVFLGWSFDDAEIRQAIARAMGPRHFTIDRPADINRAVAQLLADDQIVARCTGPMEFGARALGNRSILAHPGKAENLELLNDAIKERDFWMPFAPSILDIDAERYLSTSGKADRSAMMVAADVRPEAVVDLASAIHRRDRTARPQIVSRATNAAYYELILAFRELTGIGAVLNTSFNLHGEPIVGSPADAIDTVLRSGLRHLALGSFLLTKKA